MEDKRIINRLTDYWNRLRGELDLPPWEKFNTESLMDVWGQCCVWRVDVDGSNAKSPHQYIYVHIGSNAREAMGHDLMGQALQSRAEIFPGARIARKIDESVQHKKPLTDEGHFVNEKSQVVKYRSCLLPFGTREGKVN